MTFAPIPFSSRRLGGIRHNLQTGVLFRSPRLVCPLTSRRWIIQGPPTPGNPTPNFDDSVEEMNEDEVGKKHKKQGAKEEAGSDWKGTAFKMFEASMTTFASISILGLVGYSYTVYYKRNVLTKMEKAFEPGDPVLELAASGRKEGRQGVLHDPEVIDDEHWIPRLEQTKIDSVVSGREHGRYYLIIGEKGVGKSSMLIDAMHKIDGEGIAMFDCHADLEIFRVRLGKALNFEYHEDNIGSLFSIRGPRDASALLDIERALNKLEKVAIKRRDSVGRPLILIINSMHLLRDDDDGRDLLELMQQRAEQWAAANLATVVFNSDDYWVYERLKNYATRMEILPVGDLPRNEALVALRKHRIHSGKGEPTANQLAQVYDKVGGRLTFLNRVAKADDMLQECEKICRAEKTWFLNQCWILGSEMDDDVMDQQKYASAAMVLAKALVDKEKEMDKTWDDERGHILPQVPLHIARQIMTRADFIQSYDHINVFTIDSQARVRADSVPMQNAFREICAEPGFEKFLEDTLERIGDIESLGRTRELTIKDLWDGGKYRISTKNAKGYLERSIEMLTEKPPEEDEDDDDK